MNIWRGLAGAMILLFIVCQPVFSRPVPAASQPAPMKRPFTNHWRTVVVMPKPSLPKIHFYDKVNPAWWFGNIDDPAAPAWYRPDSHHRDFLWHLRNPFHNFDHYVIGIADKEFTRTSLEPEGSPNPEDHWDVAVARRKLAVLPFISYQRDRFRFYFGWRDRGNFGIKLNFSGSNKIPEKKPAQPSGISGI